MKKVLTNLALAGALGIALVGCGAIHSKAVSEADLLDKAESAIGIDKNNLSVIENSISSSADSVRFSVKDKKGNKYKCYFTTLVIHTSDAICQKISVDGSASSSAYDALLKAAGKCK